MRRIRIGKIYSLSTGGSNVIMEIPDWPFNLSRAGGPAKALEVLKRKEGG